MCIMCVHSVYCEYTVSLSVFSVYSYLPIMHGNTEVGVVARIPGENGNVGDSLAASKADSTASK